MTIGEAAKIAGKANATTFKGAVPQTAATSPTAKSALAAALAGIKPVTMPKIAEGTIQSAKLSPSLQKVIADISKSTTFKGAAPQTAATSPTKSALAAALAGIKPVTMPKIAEGTIQRNELSQVGSPAPVSAAAAELAPVVVDRGSDGAGARAAERFQPEGLPEVVAAALAREDREAAIELLVVLGLDEATDHLYEIEGCLLRGRKPSRLHAALSASVLLRDLADRLFPARDEPWTSRSGRRHQVGHEHVKNRLSAFVDARLRSTLSTKEHQLFQSTLDIVADWTGKGHHVPARPREAARAFRQLLEVLSTIASAYRAGDDRA
jgi:hypothetical protein